MKYNKQQHIDIGRQVYTHELSSPAAQSKYGIGHSTIDNYIREYQEANDIPTKTHKSDKKTRSNEVNNSPDIEAYMAMTKDELIDQLILAKANEARAKKGYEVKGDGPNKVYNSLYNKTSK